MTQHDHHPQCDGNQCEGLGGPTCWFNLGKDGRIKLCKRCFAKWSADGRYPAQAWETAEPAWPER